jgi:nucleoid-associated protein EbfC
LPELDPVKWERHSAFRTARRRVSRRVILPPLSLDLARRLETVDGVGRAPGGCRSRRFSKLSNEEFTMAGVGKLMKQAQKMQRQIETLQNELADKEFDVSSGGGAVTIRVNGAGKFLAIKLDEEFLKEDKEMVEQALLLAVQEAADKAKEYNETEMQKVTAGFNIPGLM